MVAGRAHDGWTMVASPSAAETLVVGLLAAATGSPRRPSSRCSPPPSSSSSLPPPPGSPRRPPRPKLAGGLQVVVGHPRPVEVVARRAHDGWIMVASPSAAEMLVAGLLPPSRWWPTARATGGRWWPLVDSGGGSVWTTVVAEQPATAVEGGAQGGKNVMYQSPLLFVARGSEGHRRSYRLSM